MGRVRVGVVGAGYLGHFHAQKYAALPGSQLVAIADPDASAREKLERLLYSFVNEGARMLEEGLPALAAHIDVLCIRDCGFPPYRGGPMWQADIRGLQVVCRRVCSFHERHGDRWAPAPLLQSLAARGKTLAEYDAR